MVIRLSEMQTEWRENMRGGTGKIAVRTLVPAARLPHGRLLAAIEIPPGAGIGEHGHDAETEFYIIHDGRAIVVDDGVEREVSAGDVVLTGGGASHSIRNASEGLVRLTALIVTH